MYDKKIEKRLSQAMSINISRQSRSTSPDKKQVYNLQNNKYKNFVYISNDNLKLQERYVTYEPKDDIRKSFIYSIEKIKSVKNSKVVQFEANLLEYQRKWLNTVEYAQHGFKETLRSYLYSINRHQASDSMYNINHDTKSLRNEFKKKRSNFVQTFDHIHQYFNCHHKFKRRKSHNQLYKTSPKLEYNSRFTFRRRIVPKFQNNKEMEEFLYANLHGKSIFKFSIEDVKDDKKNKKVSTPLTKLESNNSESEFVQEYSDKKKGRNSVIKHIAGSAFESKSSIKMKFIRYMRSLRFYCWMFKIKVIDYQLMLQNNELNRYYIITSNYDNACSKFKAILKEVKEKYLKHKDVINIYDMKRYCKCYLKLDSKLYLVRRNFMFNYLTLLLKDGTTKNDFYDNSIRYFKILDCIWKNTFKIPKIIYQDLKLDTNSTVEAILTERKYSRMTNKLSSRIDTFCKNQAMIHVKKSSYSPTRLRFETQTPVGSDIYKDNQNINMQGVYIMKKPNKNLLKDLKNEHFIDSLDISSIDDKDLKTSRNSKNIETKMVNQKLNLHSRSLVENKSEKNYLNKLTIKEEKQKTKKLKRCISSAKSFRKYNAISISTPDLVNSNTKRNLSEVRNSVKTGKFENDSKYKFVKNYHDIYQISLENYNKIFNKYKNQFNKY